jgi:predicted enzyme related to lactoylglutathione lyase
MKTAAAFRHFRAMTTVLLSCVTRSPASRSKSEDPADTLWILAFNDGEGVAGSSIIVGLHTSDLNAFQARVTANGGAVVDEIKTIKLGDREMLIGAYSDPDGHLIQAIQG